jgi:hypothetical protein
LAFGKKLPKGNTAQIFWPKSPSFLKHNRYFAPLLKDRFVTSMPTGYTLNAPGEKYCQLGESWLNLCGDTGHYCDISKMKKKRLVQNLSHIGP